MAIFNSYVKLPEGKFVPFLHWVPDCSHPWLSFRRQCGIADEREKGVDGCKGMDLRIIGLSVNLEHQNSWEEFWAVPKGDPPNPDSCYYDMLKS